MQNKMITIAAAVAALSAANVSQADIELGEGLSVTGFIDMSWSYSETDSTDSSQSMGIDQFELDFMYDFGEGLTAQVDVEYQDNGSGEEVDVEQAFVSYAVNDQFSVKAGRFLSYSGWETEEPTGLFQYSGTGYAAYFYGGYQQGLSGKYSTDMIDVAVSVVNDLGDLEGEARDSEQPAIETMFAVHPGDAWVLKAFYMTDKNEQIDETTTSVVVWTSYSVGGLTLALESNSSEYAPAVVGAGAKDATGSLLMANYAWDKMGLTLRYHQWELEDAMGATVQDMSGFTISPNFSVHDNVTIYTEARFDTDDVSGDDGTSYAIEAQIVF